MSVLQQLVTKDKQTEKYTNTQKSFTENFSLITTIESDPHLPMGSVVVDLNEKKPPTKKLQAFFVPLITGWESGIPSEICIKYVGRCSYR